MEIDELEYITNEVIPPVGGSLKYAAKVQFLYVKNGENRVKIHEDFGETLGETKEQAISKMRSKVSEWVSGQ